MTWRRGVLLATLAALAGCNAAPRPLPGIPIVLGPVQPLPRPPRPRLPAAAAAAAAVVPPVVPDIQAAATADAAVRVLQDSRAVKARTSCYVAGSTPDTGQIRDITALQRRLNGRLAVLQTRRGQRNNYSPDDVQAARDAADALAHAMPEQTPCPPPEREELAQ